MTTARIIATALALLPGILAVPVHAATRAVPIAQYHVEVDQQFAGYLLDSRGGLYHRVDITPEQVGGFAAKALTGHASTEVVLIFDPAAMTPAWLQWLAGTGGPANVAIVRRDPGGRLIDRMMLLDARPVGLEALPVAAGQPVRMQATLTMAMASMQPGPGNLNLPGGVRGSGPVALRVSAGSGSVPAPDFDHDLFSIEGLGWARERLTGPPTPGRLDQQVEFGSRLLCRDVTLIVPHAQIGPWFAWYQSIEQNGGNAERPLTLSVVDGLGNSGPLAVLGNAGLFGFEPFNHPAIGMALKVSIYCETIAFAYTVFGQ